MSTYLIVGYGSTGTYTLNAGSLTCNANEAIGYSAFSYGSFFQSGGNHVVSGTLSIGALGGSGSYSLTSNGVLSATAECVGSTGYGNFNQTGGANTVSSGLVLAMNLSSPGTYSLSGGTLACPQISGGAGASTFYFNGGTLVPTASSANFMSGLTAAYVQNSGAFINTNGQNITISQPLLNGGTNGGLQKFGAGSLTLTAANSYPGETILWGGTLVAANTAGSALGSGPLFPEGGVLAAGPSGGTISGAVEAAGAPYTIAPGAALSQGYGTLTLNGGLTSNSYTKLLFNMNSTSLGIKGTNGVYIYGGDLLNFNNGAALNISGGQIALVNTPTQTGDYRIFDNPTLTGGAMSLNDFILPSNGYSYALSTAVDSPYVDMVVGVGSAGASGGTWTYFGGGSWGTGSDWSNFLFPSSGTVTFGTYAVTSTVTLDGYRTAGSLVFTSYLNGYTLSQGTGGALTLGTSAGGSITVNSGTNTISAPLQMAGNLTIAVSSGAVLQLAGALSEAATGASFTFNGPGTLNYSATGTFSGSTNVNGGTLNLTGGYLPASSENVSATAVQTGGDNVVSAGNSLYLAGGSYTLSNSGLLSAPNEWIGSGTQGAFTQTGGTNTAASFLFVGAQAYGTYNLSGGLLSANNEELGAAHTTGNFTQTGGTHVVSTNLYVGFTGAGSYNLTSGTSGGPAGTLSAQTEYVGYGRNSGGSFSQSAGSNSATFLYAGYNGGQGNYSLSGSGLLSAYYEYVAYNSNSAYTNTFYQSGGTNTVSYYLCLGNNYGDNGAYNLSGGSLAVSSVANNGAEYIGYDGAGVFTQTGGTHTVPVPLYLGYNADGNGTYNLGLGSLGGSTEYVGYNGSGYFSQTGGVQTLSSFNGLFVGYGNGSSGTYSLSGGSLWCDHENLGYSGSGTFSQVGGIHSVNTLIIGSNPGGSGSYNLTLGNLSCQTLEDIGYYGSGGFTQWGGNNLAGWVYVGDQSSGVYQLNGGLLSTLYEIVGNSANGAFQQSGGTNTLSTYALYLGGNASGSGSYTLNPGGLLTAPMGENIGYSGNGLFTQTGGTNMAGTLCLAANTGASGTYSLQGGLLNVTSLSEGGVTAAFIFSSGTFQAASPFTTSVPITLATLGSNGVFDTNGNALTLAGPLSGPGGLQKIGAGTLTLAVSNGYTGTTLVSNGTLLLGDPNALSGSTFDTSGSGSLDFSSLTAADFGGLQGSGNLVLANANLTDVALTAGGNNANTTLSGNLSDLRGGGSLTKTGTGLLILSGDNTYGGGTTVSSGTLELASSVSLLDGSSLTVGADASAIFGFAAQDAPAARDLPSVPEPGTLALLTVAVCSAAAYQRIHPRRKKQ